MDDQDVKIMDRDYNLFQEELLFIDPLYVKEPGYVKDPEPIDFQTPLDPEIIKTISPFATTDPVIIKPLTPELVYDQPLDYSYKQQVYSGKITDASTGEAIAFATVYLVDVEGNPIASQAATAAGEFSFNTAMIVDAIAITATEFAGAVFDAYPGYGQYKLSRKTDELDPVVLPPGTRKQNYGLLILGVLIYLFTKNKRA